MRRFTTLVRSLKKFPVRLLQSPDNVKLHEVGGAADAHWCARDDADDVAFFDQALFEKALFGEVGEAVDFFDVGDVARRYTPVKRHTTACCGFGGKRRETRRSAEKGVQWCRS